MDSAVDGHGRANWRETLHRIIFEAETPGGKGFDVILILAITSSVAVVMLDSVNSVRNDYGDLLYDIEWMFTLLFSVEYILRLFCALRPFAYAKSFFGLVDLFAVVPTYLSLFLPSSQYLTVIRLLRVLRVFRVLKLAQYLSEVSLLTEALRASRRKITVFLVTVITLVVILGSLMYVIEGEENGFTSIPHSVYWAIVTLTTVGYGDVSPQTGLGKVLASMVMILGYGIIAVPTGIMTAEFSMAMRQRTSSKVCPACGAPGHDDSAAVLQDVRGKSLEKTNQER